jgi:hypothetical protein
LGLAQDRLSEAPGALQLQWRFRAGRCAAAVVQEVESGREGGHGPFHQEHGFPGH